MWHRGVERLATEHDLEAARGRMRRLTPFSPAWDAAMASVEDLERQLWLTDEDSPTIHTDSGSDDDDGVWTGAPAGMERQRELVPWR